MLALNNDGTLSVTPSLPALDRWTRNIETNSADTRSAAPRTAAEFAESLTCACGSRLPMQVRLGLKSRTRPVFEGRWCCGAACLDRRVAAAVRREMAAAGNRRPHRHRIPLGLVLLSTGAVTHDDLRRALATQHGTADRIGDVLVRDFGLSERKVAEALAAQWGCSVWNVGGINADAMSALAPRAVLEQTSMLPLRIRRDRRLGVAFGHAVDSQAIFALQRIHNLPVDAGIAPLSAWSAAHTSVLRADGVTAEEIDCDSIAEVERAAVRTIQRLQPVESRWARVHGIYWLRLWLEPVALAGGPTQIEDVVDFIYRIPSTQTSNLRAL